LSRKAEVHLEVANSVQSPMAQVLILQHECHCGRTSSPPLGISRLPCRARLGAGARMALTAATIVARQRLSAPVPPPAFGTLIIADGGGNDLSKLDVVTRNTADFILFVKFELRLHRHGCITEQAPTSAQREGLTRSCSQRPGQQLLRRLSG
jgi:hypothetical protein